MLAIPVNPLLHFLGDVRGIRALATARGLGRDIEGYLHPLSRGNIVAR